MLQTLKNAWSTKEIRSKILFTLFILLLYRVGTVIPVPFVEANDFASSLNGTILEYMNVLSGGSMGAMTLFALGVQPYINASIIIQLLAVVFPALGELGKTDKKKMNLITRIVTVVLAIVTAIGYYFLLRNGNASAGVETFLTKNAFDGPMAWFYGIVIVICYTAGASLVMWLAERINEKGIGNGISMILFAGIVAEIPDFIGIFFCINRVCSRKRIFLEHLKILQSGIRHERIYSNVSPIFFLFRDSKGIYMYATFCSKTVGGQIAYLMHLV